MTLIDNQPLGLQKIAIPRDFFVQKKSKIDCRWRDNRFCSIDLCRWRDIYGGDTGRKYFQKSHIAVFYNRVRDF